MDTGIKMQKRIKFSWLFLPLSILIFLAFALFIERSGIPYTVNPNPSTFLEPLPALVASDDEERSTADLDCLVLYDSKSGFYKKSLDTVTAALDSMKVPNSKMSISQSEKIDFHEYKTVIISLVQLSLLDDQIHELIDWVADGGKLLFAIRPDNSDTLSAIYPQLGIRRVLKNQEKEENNIPISGLF